MNKIIGATFLITAILFSACKSEQTKYNEGSPVVYRDLDEIRKDGKLKALVVNSETSYFLYRGKPMGYEYELLERLADHLDLELEIHVSENLDDLLIELKDGNIDIVAHGLTITSDRKKIAAFTDYLYLTHQVLVQKKPDNWRKMKWAEVQKHLIHDPIELIGDTVSIRNNTSYIKRISNLSRELGGKINIDTIEGNLSTGEIIKMVVEGDIKYTVADDNIAKINASYYPILKVDVPVSFSQRIGWAVNSSSQNLLTAINKWIIKERKEVDYFVIYNKYFKNKRDFRKRTKSVFYSLNKNQISKYDSIIKENAKAIGWDWRLLASLIYQESRFNINAESWAGAKGLMQMMPETATEMSVTNLSDPGDNIRAGTQYLKRMYDNFEQVEDSIQRMKFAMASYNCGYSHVLDAQNLSEVNDLKKNIWDENVEEMILELSYPENFNHEVVNFGYVRGIEPYTYVEQIFERYDHYLNFIEK